MKYITCILVACLFLSVSSGSEAASGRVDFNPGRPVASGELLVKFRSGALLDDITLINGIVQTSRELTNAIFAELRIDFMAPVFRNAPPQLSGVYRLSFHAPVQLLSALERMAEDSSVEWVQPNYLSRISATPNDTYFPASQWGLTKIQANLAWDISQGDTDIVIAIIDTGVDYNHPDLAGNIWHNPGEIPNNGVDDDGNGFVDDDIGWDFVSASSGGAPGEDMQPRDNDPMDFHGHGTHCAGIASAVTNNGIGMAGTAWNCSIMALRAGYETTNGGGLLRSSDTSAALYYAADNGADVISMSWGGGGSSTIINLAIEYANAAGCVLIAAAGNNGVTSEFYPAANVNVMAVAASDQNDARASFSNYGSWVDIAAPGTSILSTLYDDTYAWWSGTSMATPFVAGAAGLLLSYDPTLTVNEVKTQLVDSGDDISWGGAGPTKRLNAYQALLAAVGQPPDPMLRTGVVEGVNSAWTTVNLNTTYTSMVVVCSASYDREKAPGVVRVQIPGSGGGNSFDVRVDSAGGGAINDVTVCYMVVEEGVYNEVDHGVKMEAVKYTSTVTDQINAWNGEPRSYSNSYTNPAVVGQVMSYNDGRWSVFWCRGSSRVNPPGSTLRVGKHVGEDPDTSRLDETVGYIVIEAGSGTISAINYTAGLGADIVFGVNNSPAYNYPLSGLASPFPMAIVSQAGMDGANGGWAILYGANPVASSSLGLAIDEDQASDLDRGHGSEQVAYIVFDTPGIPEYQPPDPMLRTGVVEGVNSAWTTVNLDMTYTSMVVVCSASYNREKAPGVVRVKTPASGGGNSFDIRVDSAGGGAINDVTVCYMVVEEGVYNEVDHGVKMEAVKYTSTVTDQINAWNGEARSYSNSYTNPAVVGQVMSYNDGRWSVFWCRGSSRVNPPGSTLRVGKHVGEDPDTSRLDETVGYIVIEAGSGTISAISYTAGLGADTIFGVNNSPPYNYPLSGLASPFPTAIVSQAGMDGANGGWAVLYGINPVTSSSLGLAIDEDQASDLDRGHGSEQVAYIVFDTPGIPAAPQLLAKADLKPKSPPVAALLQNYPNPFNPETWIPFRLSEFEHVVIRIYNVTGRFVRRLDLGPKAPGDYINKENAAYWDGRNESGEQVSSGVYFYTIHAGEFAATKKLTILK